jgi:hypothetical protein
VYSRGRVREWAFFCGGEYFGKGPLPNPPPEYRERE